MTGALSKINLVLLAGCDTLLEKLQYTLLKIKVLHAMPQKPPHSLSRSMKWGGCSEQWTHGKLLVLTASQGRCSRDVRTSSRESSQTSSTSPWHKPQFLPAWNLPQLSPYQRNQPRIASMTIALMLIIMKCFERLVLHHLKTCLPSTFDDHSFANRANRSTEDAIALHNALSHEPMWTRVILS